jgi:hypothetical protein
MTQQREDWAAELARQYIEATLNVSVETWDRDGRQGAHDLRYDHEGLSTAVEVKLVVDADYRAMAQRIAKTGYVQDSRLTRMWDLRLKHRARVDRALRDVPDLLMHLEQRGWLDRPLWVLRKSDPVTAASLDRLGVTSLWSQRPTLKHPPGFYLMPESWGGEPSRDSWRLRLVRGWSHDQTGEVPAGAAGAGRAHGGRAPARASLAVGGDLLDRGQVRHLARDAAPLGPPRRGRRRPAARADQR